MLIIQLIISYPFNGPHPLGFSSHLRSVLLPLWKFWYVKLSPVTFYLLKKSTTVSKNRIKTILWKHDRASWELYNTLFLFFKVRGSFTKKGDCQPFFLVHILIALLTLPKWTKVKMVTCPCVLVQAVALQYNTILKTYWNN